MQIELNPHFKPDECVLYCGNAVYATLQSRDEPVNVGGYVRMWKVRALRRGTNTRQYVKLNNCKAVLTAGVQNATLFASYTEADEISKRLMETGNVIEVDIIETLKFIYEEDTYAFGFK